MVRIQHLTVASIVAAAAQTDLEVRERVVRKRKSKTEQRPLSDEIYRANKVSEDGKPSVYFAS